MLSLETIDTLFLQGTFVLLSLIVSLIFILAKKWRWNEIGFAKIDINGCKKVKYFLPIFAIFLPVIVKGFYITSSAYVLGNLFLCEATISLDKAIECMNAFFDTHQRPDCIQWREL